MSSRPGVTFDDRPSGTPEDALSPVDGSTVSPVERESSEPLPLAPLERDHFVAHVDVALRGVALVVLAGLTGMAGWMVVFAWRHLAEQRTDISYIWVILSLAALCPMIRKMWLNARRGVAPALDAKEIAAAESRAFLEAVERHDLLRTDAQRRAAEEAGGVVNAERRPEARDSCLDEPIDRGDEARIAALTKERGDPG